EPVCQLLHDCDRERHHRVRVDRRQRLPRDRLREDHRGMMRRAALPRPYPEEPREARRLEGWATRASGTASAAPWFETRRFAPLLIMRRGWIGLVAACFCVPTLLSAADIPPDQRRSGYADLGPETKAMEDDDTANPATLWVLDGEALWSTPTGA